MAPSLFPSCVLPGSVLQLNPQRSSLGEARHDIYHGHLLGLLSNSGPATPSPARGLAPFRVVMSCSDICVASVLLLDLD